MWVFVMVGNIIRGVGETPITPLGISYVEDFARPENSPFYIGMLAYNTLAFCYVVFFWGVRAKQGEKASYRYFQYNHKHVYLEKYIPVFIVLCLQADVHKAAIFVSVRNI